jgi:hypothetical protein
MKRAFIVITILILTASLFAQKEIKKSVFKAKLDENVILVAVIKGSESPFKDALIDSLNSRYSSKYIVKKVIVNKPKDITNQSYRLLIVMDKLKANLMMNGKMKTFQKTTDINNAIYFITTGDPKWKWNNSDIHHVASASETPRLSIAWKELKSKVDVILK